MLEAPERHTTARALSLAKGLRWISLSFGEMAVIRYRFWGVTIARPSPGVGLSHEVSTAAVWVV